MDQTASKATPDLDQLTIRQVTQADLPALEWDGAFINYRRMYAEIYQNTKSGKALMRVVEHLQAGIIGQAFVMLKSGEQSAADGRQRAYVFSFRVKPAWRNQGVGAYLMRFVEADLRQRGFQYVTLNVAKDNPGALRLYRRLGYEVIGEHPGIWSYTDHRGRLRRVNEPAWRMAKKLNSSSQSD